MKKILVINTKYRKFGGEDANIIEELNFLSTYYKVEYLEFDNSSKINFFDFLSFFTLSNLKSNLNLKKSINKFKPDLVYIHNLWFKGSLGILKILELKNIKYLLKIHNFRTSCSMSFFINKHINKNDFCHACNLNKKKFQIFNKYFKNSYIKSFYLIRFSKKFMKLVKKYQSKLFVLNNFQKIYLEKYGINKDNMTIFYNPIQNTSHKKNNYTPDSSYILYAGNISREKGVDKLIESWESLNLPNLNLVLVGDMSNLNPKNFNFKNSQYIGRLDHYKVLELIKGARAVVTATRLYEGQPRLLCEASTYGVPSIFPKFGGMREFFPQEYELSFIQYDYNDLKNTLMKVSDTNLLIKASNEVLKFSKKNYSYESQKNIFKKSF